MPIVVFLFAGLTLVYLCMFAQSMSGAWFNPLYTNDDAQQQLYPLHKVLDPELFPNDIITQVMEGYLPPLHYGLSYVITLLTQDPVMTGHWVGFIQLTLCIAFLFATVRVAASFPAACVSVCWLILAQPLWTRLVGGMPRGWAAPILTIFYYLLLTGRHRAILLLLFAGLLLNPPAAFLAGACYGFWLLYLVLSQETRSEGIKRLLWLAAVTPLLAITALALTKRPANIGSMVTYAEAAKMQAFQRHGGRFTFIPFRPAIQEINDVGTKVFVLNKRFVGEYARQKVVLVPLLFLLFITICSVKLKRALIPYEYWAILIGTLVVYFLSRAFAFRLYVPDRHLLLPLNLAWILIVPTALWRLCGGDSSRRQYLCGGVALALFASVIVVINGIGVRNAPGLHVRTDHLAGVYGWISRNTPKDAVIAGQPARIDAVQLSAKRIAFATAETAHPFYPVYFSEISRRIFISLGSYYSRSWSAFEKKLAAEKVDYFLFLPADFEAEQLKKVRFFRPFGRRLKKWTAHPPKQFLVNKFAEFGKPIDELDFVVYRDQEAILIDLARLRNYRQRMTNAVDVQNKAQ